MALKITKKPAAQATVTTTVSDKKKVLSEDTKTETVAPEEVGSNPGPVGEQMCEVGFEASYTHNLGNYQSARVQVSLRVPCLHAEIDSVYEFSEGWVNQRMEKLQGELASEE